MEMMRLDVVRYSMDGTYNVIHNVRLTHYIKSCQRSKYKHQKSSWLEQVTALLWHVMALATHLLLSPGEGTSNNFLEAHATTSPLEMALECYESKMPD